jgi:hypothetical protein
MKVKGIIRGQTIHLLEPISIEDGVEIEVDIPDNIIVPDWEQLKELIGIWQNDSELDDIFAEINHQRHSDLGRDISFD